VNRRRFVASAAGLGIAIPLGAAAYDRASGSAGPSELAE